MEKEEEKEGLGLEPAEPTAHTHPTHTSPDLSSLPWDQFTAGHCPSFCFLQGQDTSNQENPPGAVSGAAAPRAALSLENRG